MVALQGTDTSSRAEFQHTHATGRQRYGGAPRESDPGQASGGDSASRSCHAGDACLSDNLWSKLRINKVVPGSNIQQPPDSLGQAPKPGSFSSSQTKQQGSPARAPDLQNVSPGDSGSSGAAVGVRSQVNPPFVFSSVAKGEPVQRSPRHRPKSGSRSKLLWPEAGTFAATSMFSKSHPQDHREDLLPGVNHSVHSTYMEKMEQHRAPTAASASASQEPSSSDHRPCAALKPVLTSRHPPRLSGQRPEVMGASEEARVYYAAGQEAPNIQPSGSNAVPVDKAGPQQRPGAHPASPLDGACSPNVRSQEQSWSSLLRSASQKAQRAAQQPVPAESKIPPSHPGVMGQHAQPGPPAWEAKQTYFGKLGRLTTSASMPTPAVLGHLGVSAPSLASFVGSAPFQDFSSQQSGSAQGQAPPESVAPGVQSSPAPVRPPGTVPSAAANSSSSHVAYDPTKVVWPSAEPKAPLPEQTHQGHGTPPKVFATRMKSRATPRKPGLKGKGVLKAGTSRSPTASDAIAAAAVAAAAQGKSGDLAGLKTFLFRPDAPRHPFSQLLNPPGANQSQQDSEPVGGTQPVHAPAQEATGSSPGRLHGRAGSEGQPMASNANVADNGTAYAGVDLRGSTNESSRNPPGTGSPRVTELNSATTPLDGQPGISRGKQAAVPSLFVLLDKGIPVQGDAQHMPEPHGWGNSSFGSSAASSGNQTEPGVQQGSSDSNLRPFADGQGPVQNFPSADGSQSTKAQMGQSVKLPTAPLFFSFKGQDYRDTISTSTSAGQAEGLTSSNVRLSCCLRCLVLGS
jgi:hypothetical protein